MSVKEKNKIDVISIKEEMLVLTISDHLEWDNENEHLLLLQEKINSYLDFIENGQLAESYPDADKRIWYKLYLKISQTKWLRIF